MKVREEDRERNSGPAVRWRTESSEVRLLRLLSIAVTLEGSTSGLTLKRTICSMNSGGLLADILMDGCDRAA